MVVRPAIPKFKKKYLFMGIQIYLKMKSSQSALTSINKKITVLAFRYLSAHLQFEMNFVL